MKNIKKKIVEVSNIEDIKYPNEDLVVVTKDKNGVDCLRIYNKESKSYDKKILNDCHYKTYTFKGGDNIRLILNDSIFPNGYHVYGMIDKTDNNASFISFDSEIEYYRISSVGISKYMTFSGSTWNGWIHADDVLLHTYVDKKRATKISCTGNGKLVVSETTLSDDALKQFFKKPILNNPVFNTIKIGYTYKGYKEFFGTDISVSKSPDEIYILHTSIGDNKYIVKVNYYTGFKAKNSEDYIYKTKVKSFDLVEANEVINSQYIQPTNYKVTFDDEQETITVT